MILQAHKAEPIYKGQPRPRTIGIRFVATVPKFNDLAEWASFCENEASKIETVLYNNMPGGIYDRLLAKMMRRRASLLAVSHSPTPPPDENVSGEGAGDTQDT